MRAQPFFIVLTLFTASPLAAQDQTASGERSFASAAADVQTQLQDSVAELTRLREQVANEKIPLSRSLSDLEGELVEARQKYQQISRVLDGRTLDLSNLRTEIKSRQEEAAYLANLLSEYIRNFESRIHIAELARYRQPLEAARLAPDNSNLSSQQLFEVQTTMVMASIDRLFEALGGTRFQGTAVDAGGLLKSGEFVLMGPAAIFRSQDGESVGTAEQRLGSLEPAIIGFENPENTNAASQLVANANGHFTFDPTLGNAHKVDSIKESRWEHIQKGGPVMVPILALAAAALLVSLYKWLTMAFVRRPSHKRVRALLNAIGRHDKDSARREAQAISGPGGAMLAAGVEHLDEPRELIEEVMYEIVLATRLKLNRLLPFVAISASSAPLLGLLGTVTGIINTFKLITVFGSGDPKTLSGGISEALVTTEYGLIVAIPSLLLYAFLSRKARGIIDEMEKAAVALINQVSKAGPAPDSRMTSNLVNSDPPRVRIPEHTPVPGTSIAPATVAATNRQVREILVDLLTPMVNEKLKDGSTPAPTTS